MQEQYGLIGAIQAHRLAKASDRQETRQARNEALAAILSRLEQARRDHVADYFSERLRRETSQDLS